MSKLERLKRIVELHQYDEFLYPDHAADFEDPLDPRILIDATTANALLKVYSALNQENQAKFERTTVDPYKPFYVHIRCFAQALQSRSGVTIDVKGGVATVKANLGNVPVKIVDRD